MKTYLKGALHVHSNMSDSGSSPQVAVDTYYKSGFDFMFFTDHKTNFDISKQVTNTHGMVIMGGVELDCGKDPKPNYNFNKEPREDWVHLLGSNTMLNEFGDSAYPHINALGVYGTNMKFDVIDGNIGKTYENVIDVINENKGIPMINHPNWWFCSSVRELLNVDRNYLLEIGNSEETNYAGTFAKESMETTWDILLTRGKNVFAVSSDDAHHYVKTEKEPWLDYDCGFVYVYAEKNEASILEALRNGDFYASNGLKLKEYTVNEKCINVKVEPENGVKYCIMFKGRMGLPLKFVYGTEGTYNFTGEFDEEYVRVKVISNKIKETYWHLSNGLYNEACYTQPVFKNGKKIKI